MVKSLRIKFAQKEKMTYSDEDVNKELENARLIIDNRTQRQKKLTDVQNELHEQNEKLTCVKSLLGWSGVVAIAAALPLLYYKRPNDAICVIALASILNSTESYVCVRKMEVIKLWHDIKKEKKIINNITEKFKIRNEIDSTIINDGNVLMAGHCMSCVPETNVVKRYNKIRNIFTLVNCSYFTRNIESQIEQNFS